MYYSLFLGNNWSTFRIHVLVFNCHIFDNLWLTLLVTGLAMMSLCHIYTQCIAVKTMTLLLLMVSGPGVT